MEALPYGRRELPKEKKMKYVVMVSHGDFAPGLRSAVFMMTGPKDEVLCTNLRSDMSADQFQENFRELVKPIGAEDEVILLCDILGGSPMTKSLEVLSERNLLERSLVLTGMNMPMIPLYRRYSPIKEKRFTGTAEPLNTGQVSESAV